MKVPFPAPGRVSEIMHSQMTSMTTNATTKSSSEWSIVSKVPSNGAGLAGTFSNITPSFAGVRRSRALTGGSVTSTKSMETDWYVGGRYEICSTSAIWQSIELDTAERPIRVAVLKDKESVLLLKTDEHPATGVNVGLVVPSSGESPGWLSLSLLPIQRLEGSWEEAARYKVESEVTLRKDQFLSSEIISRALKGEEVNVLELGTNEGERKQKPRLRMLVSTESGTIGWISPETKSGTRLLRPENLLRSQVDVKPRRSLKSGLQKSSLASLPWEVGGKYRMVQRANLRDRACLTGKEVGRICAGSLVVVSAIEQVPCPSMGWCPCAYISICEGAGMGRTGWVRCAAKDGLDIIDSRNFNEVARMKRRHSQEKQREEAAEQARLEELEAEERAREDAEKQRREEAEAAAAAAAERAVEEEERLVASKGKFRLFGGGSPSKQDLKKVPCMGSVLGLGCFP